jgi:hypothetical protein
MAMALFPARTEQFECFGHRISRFRGQEVFSSVFAGAGVGGRWRRLRLFLAQVWKKGWDLRQQNGLSRYSDGFWPVQVPWVKTHLRQERATPVPTTSSFKYRVEVI